ncbi:hypothetical protein K435DRAFT_793049 [Dendrothele bispora CBS 962.96]|uniref:GH16 domain-containing protein n=1 Tax=Dendrothele bispora (strain CBS 962.96) TaxID=1314807 RepID=A0A4S8MGP0_DENBC|nr:hypothetical protein K435DRAFT_793049 [Dendrothele bispora CBS 962.96]
MFLGSFSGTLNYVNKSFASDNGIAYVQDGKVLMKGDVTTWLADGELRNSIRISSISQCNTRLFMLDINHAPWGCAIWPAWWTVVGGQWPFFIDGPAKSISSKESTTTSITKLSGIQVPSNGQNNTNLRRNDPSPAQVAAYKKWSRASYREDFNLQGGSVFVMRWDKNGIAVFILSFWRIRILDLFTSPPISLFTSSHVNRVPFCVAVPADIVCDTPSPSQWGSPLAALEPGGCDLIRNFVNHSIVFDLTFCGNCAGNSYATSGCPECVVEHHIKVYKKQPVSAIRGR